MATTAAPMGTSFDSGHQDMIHDAQLDYYGKRLATCSSDRTIRIFDVENDQSRQIAVLQGHDGPVWQISWAHPRFGNILASCSYDSKVYIWREIDGQWLKVRDHTVHTASVNSIAWAPHEYGLMLACGSSDGRVSVLTYKDDATWDSQVFSAHNIGVNAVSWAPATLPGSLLQSQQPTQQQQQQQQQEQQQQQQKQITRRLATAGCDNTIKIWREESGQFKEEITLEGHTDWVRDVAWAPSIGLPNTYLASCGQDRQVIIWTQESPSAPWNKRYLRSEAFPDVVWRVSWSTSGNILAVSCGDNKVTLWKENLDGEWQMVGDVVEGGSNAPAGAGGVVGH